MHPDSWRENASSGDRCGDRGLSSTDQHRPCGSSVAAGATDGYGTGKVHAGGDRGSTATRPATTTNALQEHAAGKGPAGLDLRGSKQFADLNLPAISTRPPVTTGRAPDGDFAAHRGRLSVATIAAAATNRLQKQARGEHAGSGERRRTQCCKHRPTIASLASIGADGKHTTVGACITTPSTNALGYDSW